MRKRTEATSQRVKEEGGATSPVGRVEGVANDRSIHEAYTCSLIFGAGTRLRSLRSDIANLNDALLNLVHQETQSNRLGEQAQPSATYR